MAKKRDPTTLWRIGFYLLMAFNWNNLHKGPFAEDDVWEKAMSHNQYEFIYDIAPKTAEAVRQINLLGILVCVLSAIDVNPWITSNSMLIYALLQFQYVLTSATTFVNHEYLFALLAVLNCFYFATGAKDQSGTNDNESIEKCKGRCGWLQALRGQIIVVYFYGALWKTHPDWLDGTIVKGIFLAFEEQNVSRGIPWSKLDNMDPSIWFFVAYGGIVLDGLLFVVLMFLPPGSKMQLLSLIFHGFTGFTMSQRIGYSFPITMIMSGLLFMPLEEDDEESKMNHAKWITHQLQINTGYTKKKKGKKRYVLPMLWICVQWLLPLRMPIVSRMNFMHTFEGYRYSWTMMLHNKVSLHSPGLTFMALRPKCSGKYFPNPMAAQNALMDVQSFPYEALLIQKCARCLIVAQLFPRQLPKLANAVHSVVSPMCEGSGTLSVTASYFSSTNEGPFFRTIDPTVDLMQVFNSQVALPLPLKFWKALIDKPPSQKDEFILRNIGGASKLIDTLNFIEPSDIGNPIIARDSSTQKLILVDRSPCLKVDPIRIHSVNSYIKVVKSPKPLKLKACSDINLSECKSILIPVGVVNSVPAIRTLLISWDDEQDYDFNNASCSESTEEDIIIEIKRL